MNKFKRLIATALSGLIVLVSSACDPASFMNSSQEEEHTHTYKFSYLLEPGCESEGVRKAACACGKEYSFVVDALGHKGGYATCKQKAVCVVCKKEYGELAEHNYVNSTCTVCGYSTIEKPNTYVLNVSNFNGGYGSEWLYEAAARFEEVHKNTVFSNGKKGVTVRVNPVKQQAGFIAPNIMDGKDHVYFTEYAYYYDLLGQGVLGDITEAVTGDLSVYGDYGATIESKLTEQQRDYYNVNGRYYGIPHYSGYGGLTYNKRLFDNYDYYFAATPIGNDLIGKFVTNSNPVKSAGPDGIQATFDDGLPATYEEFFWLCDRIIRDGNTPVMLNGANYKDYAQYLTKALATDYEGLDQMLLNYTFDGMATDLATMDDAGNVILDTSPTMITKENGYELARQAGKAYALSFMHQLITSNGFSYMNPDFDSITLTHLRAQGEYLCSEAFNRPKAMLIDGIWWQNEAAPIFDEAATEFGTAFGVMGSDFAWMPLPKATKDKVGEGITLFDQIYSMCFMKPGLSGEEQEIALEFIKFCYTQESLVEFTQVTGTPKALNYTMSEEEISSLTPFARSIWEIRRQPTTKIVYPYAKNDFYRANQSALSNLFRSNVWGYELTFEVEAFVIMPIKAKEFFDGILQYRSSHWSNWMYNA